MKGMEPKGNSGRSICSSRDKGFYRQCLEGRSLKLTVNGDYLRKITSNMLFSSGVSRYNFYEFTLLTVVYITEGV